MNYLVLDLETTTKNVHGRVGNPWYNTIVAIGYKSPEQNVADAIYGTDLNRVLSSLHDYEFLVGHNIKYDLLYLWCKDEFQAWLKKGGRIWDTQLVEYLLTGQQTKFAALRELATVKYGCKSREKKMEKYWEQGIDTDSIPLELVIEDVTSDVMDTEAIFLQQYEVAQKKRMLPLITSQMEALLATTEMEYNGFALDKEKFNLNKQRLLELVDRVEKEIKDIAMNYWDIPIEFNPSSPAHISALLFGGSFKVPEKEVRGFFKNGNPKFVKVDKEYSIIGCQNKPRSDWKTKKEGVYKTDDEVLSFFENGGHGQTKDVALKLLSYRQLQKQISTYYEGIENFIYHDDGYVIRPQFSHCGYGDKSHIFGGTSTGRLSCNKPNLQNQPRPGNSKVTEHFISRYNGGKLICLDYKQLEVVALAYLSQDKRLIKDVVEGVDIHRMLAARMFKCRAEDVTSEQRQIIKPCTFLVIYGGGYIKLAKAQKLTEKFAKDFIATFYERYPTVKLWQKGMIELVKSRMKLVNDKFTPLGEFVYSSEIRTCTGRLLRFETVDSPDFVRKDGQTIGFNPTDIKNYPVQSFATADIVLLALGKLWRNSLIHRDKFLLVNTVHDSIMVDCRPEWVEFACKFVKNELQYIKSDLKTLIGKEFELPLTVDLKMGASWYECV